MTSRSKPTRLDWADIVRSAKLARGEWILAQAGAPESSLRIIGKGRNRALNDPDGYLQGTMPEKVDVDGVVRGDLYVRFIGDATVADEEGSVFRTVSITPDLKASVVEMARDQGVTTSSIIRDIVKAYLKKGSRLKPRPESETLNTLVDMRTWEAAVERADNEGLTLADVIRDELGRRVRSHRASSTWRE